MWLSILSAHLDDFAPGPSSVPFRTASPKAGVRFVFSGRLVLLKGLDNLIRAFAEAKEQLPGAVLTIIGDGPERESLESLAARLGVQESIFFEGALPHDKMAEELVRHDVFVFPSRLDVFGLSVAEAVACGLPVVCSKNVGAARDLVRDNGVIFDPDKVDELTHAMVRLGRDPDLRRCMAHAAREVRADHGLENAVAGFCEGLSLACPNFSPMPVSRRTRAQETTAATHGRWGDQPAS
jgi:glycosyltransferase involved in cell wall biosynthesis